MNAWIFYGTVVPGSAAMFLAADMCRDWWMTRLQRRRQAATPKSPRFTADELAALREIARADAEAARR